METLSRMPLGLRMFFYHQVQIGLDDQNDNRRARRPLGTQFAGLVRKVVDGNRARGAIFMSQSTEKAVS